MRSSGIADRSRSEAPIHVASDRDRPIDIRADLTSGFANRLINRKVGGLVLQGIVPPSDRLDWQQDLTTHLLRKCSHFNPTRGTWPAFVHTVIDHQIASLLDYRFAAKRHPQRLVGHPAAGEVTSLAQVVDDAGHDRRTGGRRRSERERSELKHDVDAVLECLLPEDRMLCSRLMHNSTSEVARDLGIPDSTLRDRIRRLRPMFEDAGLRAYFSRNRRERQE